MSRDGGIVDHKWTTKPVRIDDLKQGDMTTASYAGSVSTYLKLNEAIYVGPWIRMGGATDIEIQQQTLGGFDYDDTGFFHGSLDINSSDENIIITDPSTTQRVILGRLTSSGYGLQVNNSAGQSVFKLWGNEADLCGWTIGTTSIDKVNGTHQLNIDSSNEYIRIVNSSQERVRLGKITTGNYGLKILDASGGTLMDISGSTAEISGLTIGTGTIKTSNFSTGLSGWQIDSSGNAEFGNIISRGQIQASTFSYDNITATAGSQIITKSASTVYQDMTVPTNGTVTGIAIDSGGSGYTTGALTFTGGGGSGAAGTVTSVHGVSGAILAVNISNAGSGYNTDLTITRAGGSGAVLTPTLSSTTWSMRIKKEPAGGSTGFANSDICRIKAVSSSGAVNSTWFQISSLDTDIDEYDGVTCTYKSGTQNIIYKAGTAVVDYGASGQGFIYLTSIATSNDLAELQNAPYIVFGKHAGSPWSTITSITRIGELNGSYGYGSTAYGAAFGEYASGKANITIDSTNGIRIRSHSTTVAQWEIDGDIILGNTSGSTADLKIYGGSSSNYVQMNSGNLQFKVGASTFNFPFVQYIPETALTFGTEFDFTDAGLVDIPEGYTYEVMFLPKAMPVDGNFIGLFAESKTSSTFMPIMKKFSGGLGGTNAVTSSFTRAGFRHRGSDINTGSIAYNNAVDSDDGYHTLDVSGLSSFDPAEVDTVQVFYSIANDHISKDGTCNLILRAGEQDTGGGNDWEDAASYHETTQQTWIPAAATGTGMIELSYLNTTGDYLSDYLVSIILGSVDGHGSGSEPSFEGTITKIIYKDSGAYSEIAGSDMMAAMVIAKQT